MRILNICKNKLQLNEKIFDYDELFNKDFYNKSNVIADEFNSDSFYSNELFLYYVQRFYALYLFCKENNVEKIIVNNNKELSLFAIDIANKLGIKVICNKYIIISRIVLSCLFYILASFLLIFWLMLFRIKRVKSKLDLAKPFSIVRTKSGKEKISKFNISFVEESLFIEESIYSYFSIGIRLRWLFIAFFNSFSNLKSARLFYKNKIGCYSSFLVFEIYKKRILHTIIYSYVIEAFVKEQTSDLFYTANNLDRFSVIEEKVAKKYNKTTICIPHGLEYGFKFPKGFSCDIFYTNSLYAADYLNKIYCVNKFVFDEKIAETMFKVKNDQYIHNPILVFFTEPREVYVNKQIIESLLPLLKDQGIQLHLKLHPKDNIKDYSVYNLPIIKDLSDSICGNICISRKSTTLLEASYNKSKCAAILLNSKDQAIFDTFPSLHSERIEAFNSIETLILWIISNFKKNNGMN